MLRFVHKHTGEFYSHLYIFEVKIVGDYHNRE